jgi:hypothetical protein
MHPPATRNVPEALQELRALVQLAHSAAGRAQAGLRGDARELAGRISQHLRYLRGVSELLIHEATREEHPSREARPALHEHAATR